MIFVIDLLVVDNSKEMGGHYWIYCWRFLCENVQMCVWRSSTVGLLTHREQLIIRLFYCDQIEDFGFKSDNFDFQVLFLGMPVDYPGMIDLDKRDVQGKSKYGTGAGNRL